MLVCIILISKDSHNEYTTRIEQLLAMCLYVLDDITAVNSVNTEQTTKLNELTASLDQEKVKVTNLEGQCTCPLPSMWVINRQGN